MFLENSRYARVPQVVTKTIDGRTVVAIRLRRLPIVEGDPVMVEGGSRLDVMAQRNFQDGTMFWHIADANTDLEAPELVRVVGRIISVPSR
ncbi:MAG: hypothetical protein ABJC63_01130 [Gemmatimonadales bacterium]